MTSFAPPGVVDFIESLRPHSAAGHCAKEFDSFVPDFSRLNSARHSAGRVDSFHAAKKGSITTANAPKVPPAVDAMTTMDICQLAFAKSIRDLHSGFLHDLKVELHTALEPLCSESAATVANSRAVESLQQIERHLETLEMPSVDVQTIGSDIQQASSAQCELIKASEAQLRHDIGLVQQQMETLRQQQLESLEVGRRAELQAANFEDILRNTLFRVTRVIEMQESFSERTGESVVELQETSSQSLKHVQDMAASLEVKFARCVREQPVNVDFSKVFSRISQVCESSSNDNTVLLKEMGKIQQALNLDYVRTADIFPRKKSRRGSSRSSLTVNVLTPSDMSEQLVSERGIAGDILEFPDGSLIPLSQRARTHCHDVGTEVDKTILCDLLVESGMQTEPTKMMTHRWSRRTGAEGKRSSDKLMPKPQARLVADVDDMKARARAALLKPQYDVRDRYHAKGCAQAIAKHRMFECSTLALIVLNAVWIAIDTDLNPSEVLHKAPLIFQLADNIFCLYFTAELGIRFVAFRHKRDCIKDFWFVFDALLVFMMVFETWLLTIILVAAGEGSAGDWGKSSILRVLRAVKMLRLSRMARLLRSVPELIILMKGVKAASRSVAVFFGMWMIIVYVFALVLRQLSPTDSAYFGSVPEAMNTLLLRGILPSQASLIDGASVENWVFWPLLLAFVCIAVLVLSNMLVGVMVEVVGVIAIAEKEGLTVMHVASSLRGVYEASGFDPGALLNEREFAQLVTSPQAATIIEEAGADLVLLVDMIPNLFDDLSRVGENGLSFESFVELVLNMRQTNPAKVKDMKEQLRMIKAAFGDSKESTDKALNQILTELKVIKADVEDLRERDAESECSGSRVMCPLSECVLWCSSGHVRKPVE